MQFDINIVLAEWLIHSIFQIVPIILNNSTGALYQTQTNPEDDIISISIASRLHGVRSTNIELALSIPANPLGIVVFVHGGGSGRASPRNKLVADSMNKSGFANVLVDLLGPEEKERDQRTFEYRFNIALLSERLVGVIKWLKDNQDTSSLDVGLFGASTGSTAALSVASTFTYSHDAGIKAVVSRGGRPDLVAPGLLQALETPTLFLVGEKDKEVIRWTKDVFKELKKMGEKKIVVIPGAGHLFEEQGSMEQVSDLAEGWFRRFLAPS